MIVREDQPDCTNLERSDHDLPRVERQRIHRPLGRDLVGDQAMRCVQIEDAQGLSPIEGHLRPQIVENGIAPCQDVPLARAFEEHAPHERRNGCDEVVEAGRLRGSAQADAASSRQNATGGAEFSEQFLDNFRRILEIDDLGQLLQDGSVPNLRSRMRWRRVPITSTARPGRVGSAIITA